MISISKTKAGFNTGGMPEKILALAEYDRALISSIYISKENKAIIERAAANVVSNYFNELLDAKARVMPLSFHHVYEHNQVGTRSGRLFEKQVTSTGAGATISYSFKPSRTRTESGYIFKYKASVMESGQMVRVVPVNATVLYFFSEKVGAHVFSVGSLIPNPGGKAVKNSFKNEFNNFTRYKAKGVLIQLGFWTKVHRALVLKRKMKVSKINYQGLTIPSSVVSKSIADAQRDAHQVATGVLALSGE